MFVQRRGRVRSFVTEDDGFAFTWDAGLVVISSAHISEGLHCLSPLSMYNPPKKPQISPGDGVALALESLSP